MNPGYHRTADRLVPFVLPLLSDEDIKLAASESHDQESGDLRNQRAREVIDSFAYLGSLASSPATFDEAAVLAVTEDPTLRPLEIGIELGLIERADNDRFSISQESKKLFESMLT